MPHAAQEGRSEAYKSGVSEARQANIRRGGDA